VKIRLRRTAPRDRSSKAGLWESLGLPSPSSGLTGPSPGPKRESTQMSAIVRNERGEGIHGGRFGGVINGFHPSAFILHPFRPYGIIPSMKRLGRWLFNFAAAVSLVLCVASCALWIRSLDKHEWISRVGRHRTVGQSIINTSLTTIDCHESSLYVGRAGWNSSLPKLADAPAVWQFSSGEPISFLPKFSVWSFGRRGPVWLPVSGSSPYPASAPVTRGFAFVEWEFGLRIWVLVVIFGIAPTIRALHRPLRRRLHRILRSRKARERMKRGKCRACGYDLRATPDRCPECGAIQPAAKGSAT
jgi:hypothetical protein